MAAPAIILQARMASQRLPGKALAMIGGRSALEHCLRRLGASGFRVVLATTTRIADDALEAIAERLGIDVFRGDEQDVLGRYVACAHHLDIDPVIRATADNPGVDIDAPRRVLTALAEPGVHYVYEEGLPCGAAVEAVRTAALAEAARLTAEPYDREHVTPFVRRRADLFGVVRLQAPAALVRPDLRITVDTVDDLQRLRELYAMAGDDMPSLMQLIAAARRIPRREVA